MVLGKFQDKIQFIWNLAEILRGTYKSEQYRDVVLPMCVIRRFDCVLESTKKDVLRKREELKSLKLDKVDDILNRITGVGFNNTSLYDFSKLIADPDHIAENFRNYINGFSQNARDIIEHFLFDNEITKMDKHNLLYQIIKEFSAVDLHPNVVPNDEMGYIFEELIRRFSEHVEAGDHFTPREVIKLMVNILLSEDSQQLTQKGIITTVYDPACGTGGMLSVTEDYIKKLNSHAQIEVFGQEFNDQSYAICKSDMLIKGQNSEHIIFGDTFTEDGLPDKKFRYMLANPPFGVQWKTQSEKIYEESKNMGYNGRFGAGTPRISDGSFLFLQHMISKMQEDEQGSRIAIVFNGSPLFSGDAGSGESEIRKWIIEKDWLEAIVALPPDLFYNTGIFTYVWIVTNRKNNDPAIGPVRTGKVQLLNAIDFYEKMKKSLGNKRNYITEEQIAQITQIYGNFQQSEHCKIFDNQFFGYSKIIVERPLKLNFQVTPARIQRLYDESAFQKLIEPKKSKEKTLDDVNLAKKIESDILKILNQIDSSKIWKNKEEFSAVLDEKFRGVSFYEKNLKKALINALSERDETAESILEKGQIQADTELRDSENVPLGEDIKEYFNREVQPYVPDAWIDEEKTKIGYEINFTRYFWKYTPLRPSTEIFKELEQLEQDIKKQLENLRNG